MGPLFAEVGQGIKTKGQWVSRMQHKRAGHVVGVSRLCRSRPYCHEKGIFIVFTINKTYWARARLKLWDGDGKKKQKGMPIDAAYGSPCAFPSPYTLLVFRHPLQLFFPHDVYEVKCYTSKEDTAYRKSGYFVKCDVFSLADKCECSFCQPR